ncbi:MAG: hypothetical protein MUC91_04810 [Verrucomicrobia bacterium]|nr:hypothetical protein [Verrucomicrobiota bacterium]
MKKPTLITLIVGVVIGAIAYKLLWTAVAPKIEHRIEQAGLTENEKAANGPLPGDVSLYAKELAAQQKIPTPGYYSSLNGAEISDSQRSGFFPAATFTGSWDGPNQVFAWRSEDDYQATAYINNRKPGELYIGGGANPPLTGIVPAGPYIAKADATTGRQIWRTYVENANASGKWFGAINLNILPSGNIVLAWENNIALIDGDSGLILKRTSLPTGDTPPEQSNYKHVTIAPDGTLILKNQTRPNDYPYQGTMAIIRGVVEGHTQPNSHLCAVNPDTLELLDDISLPEPATAPFIIDRFEGKIACYIGVNSGALRYFWDPATQQLAQDKTWVASVMQKGQSCADAPTMLGEWVILQLNGLGSDTMSSSVVAVHEKDSSRTNVIFPFGQLKKGEWSFAPPKAGADLENNMIYSADMGIGKLAGIKLDPATGGMQTVFVVDDMTTAFMPLIGPKDKRVLLASNMKKNVSAEPIKATLFTANYKEQVTWRDAASGRLLAASDFFEPMTFGSLLTPGYGGRVHYSSGKGFITLQVMPAKTK